MPSPEHDAAELVAHALKLDRVGLVLRARDELSADELERLERLARRRLAREPLQHLLGALEWGGLTLRVTPEALIPRPETEVLLELALGALAGRPAPRVLDVGSGSGALALAVKRARPDARVTGGDVSEAALRLARENARLNGLDVPFVCSDLLAAVPGPWDLIVSNPPYLPDADAADAQPEVRHDPALALYGGPDGLTLARRLVAQAVRALEPGGALLLELDPRNVRQLAGEMGGWDVRVYADLVGRERFLWGALAQAVVG